MRKAVFFDVDNTLVSHSTYPSHVPEPTLEALRLLRERGHVVSLATGRSLATAGRLMKELWFENAVLCSGAHIIADGKPLFVAHIEQALAESFVRRGRELGCAIFACTDYTMYTERASDESLNYIRNESGLSDILRPIGEMAGVCYMNLFGDALPEPGEITSACVTYEKGWIEIRPKGISKATGIRKLSEHYGITMEDTVAFGDGNNDLEMLRAAGTGIAVGGAPAEVTAAADIVTGGIDEGGIFDALRRLGLI